MNPKKSSSPLRFILKIVISIVVIALILLITMFLALPFLLSSDFARKKVVGLMAKETQRPVSIDTLSFSWKKGVEVNGFTIKSQDQSPFLSVNDIRLTISWSALLARKMNIQTLAMNGVKVTITREKSGKTNMSGLFEPIKKEAAPKKKPEFPPKHLPALFLDAHLKDGDFTFIDQRLDTTTRIRNLNADLSVQSLTEPIALLLNGEIAVNERSPEQLAVTGSVHLAPEGKVDPRKAQGTLEMKAGFGHLNALFDLAKFDTSGEATGASLSCFLDLYKLAELSAGILGFPPDFSMQGQVTTDLKARGNVHSQIAINGETHLRNLLLTGGPFKDAPLKQPQIDLVQDITVNFGDKVIEIGKFDLKSDFLTLFTSGKISDFQKEPTFALKINGAGDIRETTRVLEQPLSMPSDLKLAGTMNFAFFAKGTQSALNFKGETAISDLQIHAAFLGGHPFQEKSLDITPDLLINIPQSTIKINSLRLQSASLNGDLEGTIDNEKDIDLKMRLSAALANLKKQLPNVLPPTFPSEGQLASQLTLQGNLKKSLSIKGNHSIDEAVIILSPPSSSADQKSPSLSPLSIPKLTVNHDLLYAIDRDNLTMTKLKAASPFLNFDGSGTLSQVSKNLFTKFQGNLSVDLTEMQKLLKGLFSEKVIANGKGALTFNGEGSLKYSEDEPVLSSWNGTGSLSLESIDYGGLGSIKNLHSTQLSLEKGLLRSTLECLLNHGPSRLQGTFDFRTKNPTIQITLDGKDVQISQDLKILGYIIPILIVSPSGQLTGKGNFSAQASWQGTDWNSEVSKTITGKGTLSLNDGILQSEDVLSLILKSFGKPETLAFQQILTGFRLAEGKIYNDNIQVNGTELKFGLHGWTSLAYDPSQKGNSMDYTVTGDFLGKSIGKDGEKVLSLLGGGRPIIPVGIGGTVQKPKVSIKMPKAKDLFKGLFNPPRGKN